MKRFVLNKAVSRKKQTARKNKNQPDGKNHGKNTGPSRVNMDILNNKAFSDVTFIVGSTQERIDCHKVFLGTRSPVFEIMFADRWTDENPIEVPDVEPTEFRAFLEYIYANQTHFVEVSDVDSMLYLAEKYDVGPLKTRCQTFLKTKLRTPVFPAVCNVVVFEVLQIAEKYNLTSVSNKAAKSVANNFNSLSKTRGFLKLSEESLCKVLACEGIALEEIKIFQHVYRWAVFQCTGKNVKVSLKDPRKFFGSCLFQIRFPAMSSADLEIVRNYKILTAEETTEILNFIALSAEHKNDPSSSEQLLYEHQPRMWLVDGTRAVSFKSIKRCGSKCPIILKAQNFPSSSIMFFRWNEECDWIQADEDLLVHGLEFLGPTIKDAYYDVSVVFKIFIDSKFHSESERMTKQLFGRRGQNLLFVFDKPVAIEKSTYDEDKFTSRCVIEYTVTGPPTNIFKRDASERKYLTGRKTQISVYWKGQTLATVLFK